MIINICEVCAKREHKLSWFNTRKSSTGICGLCNTSHDEFGHPLRMVSTYSALPEFLFERTTGVYAQPTKTDWR
jgi:hypothetical protein